MSGRPIAPCDYQVIEIFRSIGSADFQVIRSLDLQAHRTIARERHSLPHEINWLSGCQCPAQLLQLPTLLQLSAQLVAPRALDLCGYFFVWPPNDFPHFPVAAMCLDGFKPTTFAQCFGQAHRLRPVTDAVGSVDADVAQADHGFWPEIDNPAKEFFARRGFEVGYWDDRLRPSPHDFGFGGRFFFRTIILDVSRKYARAVIHCRGPRRSTAPSVSVVRLILVAHHPRRQSRSVCCRPRCHFLNLSRCEIYRIVMDCSDFLVLPSGEFR